MGFERKIPSNVGELKSFMKQLHENKGHVKSVKLNESNSHIEVDLDWMANTKYPDVYMPVRRAKLQEAKDLLAKMLAESDQGFPPSDHEIQALYDLIDPTGR